MRHSSTATQRWRGAARPPRVTSVGPFFNHQQPGTWRELELGGRPHAACGTEGHSPVLAPGVCGWEGAGRGEIPHERNRAAPGVASVHLTSTSEATWQPLSPPRATGSIEQGPQLSVTTVLEVTAQRGRDTRPAQSPRHGLSSTKSEVGSGDQGGVTVTEVLVPQRGASRAPNIVWWGRRTWELAAADGGTCQPCPRPRSP